jgi:hypothetical protein
MKTGTIDVEFASGESSLKWNRQRGFLVDVFMLVFMFMGVFMRMLMSASCAVRGAPDSAYRSRNQRND